MKEILFLTPDEAWPGFALAGVRHQSLEPHEIWAALEVACADPDIGVIAADIRLLGGVDTENLRSLTDRWPGVLVTLPAPAGEVGPPEDDLERLVRRALGYHVRLEV